MTTAARSAPTLEITAASDVMDLHSDSGLEFGDGDIDLDVPSTGLHDDDVSLHDAGADADLHVQTTSADQDDFMADQEDLLEDDLVIYDDPSIDEANQKPMNTPGSELPAPVVIEEDLIDYSDEEEEPVSNNQESASNLTDTHVGHDLPAESDFAEQIIEYDEPAEASAATVAEPSLQGHDVNERDGGSGSKVQPQESDWHAQSPSDSHDDLQGQHSPYEAVQQHPEIGLHTDADTTSHTVQPDEASKGGDTLYEEVFSHQVTINYNGVELWLFKRHDFDDSGDYLLDDDLPANKPMSSLLDTCRSTLGPDVSDDMELGLRLDSFKNIEMWQEHSSCAFVTLEHLVSLYLQLHIQDGTSDPESFYMTLLFRPRVVTLISEIQKAAADGIGHSGLHEAIDAGRTAFGAQLVHDSTGNHSVWDEEEHHQEEKWDGGGGLSNENEHDVEYEEENKKSLEDINNEYEEKINEALDEENDPEEVSQPTVQSLNSAALPSKLGSPGDGSTTQSPKNLLYGNEDSVLQPNTHLSPSDFQASPHAEEDLLDYSDDEEDANVTHVDSSLVHEPSSSSSTVQGDAKSSIEGGVQDLIDPGDFDEASGDTTYAYQENETKEAFAEDEALDLGLGMGFDDQVYNEHYNEENEQADQDNGVEDPEGYPIEYALQANDEITNHYDNVGDQNVDALTDLTSAKLGENGSNAAETTSGNDELTGADDLLYLDTVDTAADISTHDQASGTAAQELIDFDDDGDGEDGEAPLATSVAADPVVSSSSGLQDLSPPGQKRKIDEASNDGGEATDLTDAKRPRV